MYNRFFKGNTTQQVWCIPVPEPAAGLAAVGNIAFVASSLQSGLLTLYIAGQKVQIAGVLDRYRHERRPRTSPPRSTR